VAAEVHDFAIGYVERVIPARVSTIPYAKSVASGFERRLDRLAIFDRVDALAVNRDHKPAASQLDTKPKSAGHPERC
jgi:hypothetical protein